MSSIDSFIALGDDFEPVVRSIDLGLVIEHVRRLDPMAFARHFKGYRPQVLGRKRVTEALRFEVFQRKNETVAEILILLWNQVHRDLYQAMVALVRTVNENVEEIERIEDARANDFVDELLLRFDRRQIHACVRLNEVRFSPEVLAARFGGEGTPSAPASDAEPAPAASPETPPAAPPAEGGSNPD